VDPIVVKTVSNTSLSTEKDKLFLESSEDLLQLCIVAVSARSAKNNKTGKVPFFMLISKQK
jgi:hypothetical protein